MLKKFQQENTTPFCDAQYRSIALHNVTHKYEQYEHYIKELETKIKAMKQEREVKQTGEPTDVQATEADKIANKRQQDAIR